MKTGWQINSEGTKTEDGLPYYRHLNHYFPFIIVGKGNMSFNDNILPRSWELIDFLHKNFRELISSIPIEVDFIPLREELALHGIKVDANGKTPASVTKFLADNLHNILLGIPIEVTDIFFSEKLKTRNIAVTFKENSLIPCFTEYTAEDFDRLFMLVEKSFLKFNMPLIYKGTLLTPSFVKTIPELQYTLNKESQYFMNLIPAYFLEVPQGMSKAFVPILTIELFEKPYVRVFFYPMEYDPDAYRCEMDIIVARR